MTHEQFAYWLQGFIEISQPEIITSEQLQIIQDHLNLVLGIENVSDKSIWNNDCINTNDQLFCTAQAPNLCSPLGNEISTINLKKTSTFDSRNISFHFDTPKTLSASSGIAAPEFFDRRYTSNPNITVYTPPNFTNEQNEGPIVVSC